MKKKSFFLIGMTSVLLAFGMTGCDNGTSNGGGNTPIPSYPQNPGSGPEYPSAAPKIADDFDELKALVQPGKTGTVYIVDRVEVTESLLIPNGVKVVIATEEYAIRNPSTGILAAVSAVPTLNYGELVVRNGAVLAVQSGGAVVVGNTSDASKIGLLRIEAGGKFHVPYGATLAVTVGSHVIVEKDDGVPTANTGLFIDEGAKLAIVGLGAGTAVSGQPEGNAPASVIVIESGAPAVIDVTTATIYTDEGATTHAPDTVAENIVAGAGAATATSPAKSTATASEIGTLFGNGATTVTYTGTTTTIPAFPAATDKALIITGTITAQSANISVGTLEIVAGGKLTTTTGTLTADTLTNSGKLSASAAITADTLTNSGELSASAAITADTLTNSGELTTSAAITADTLTNSGELSASAAITADTLTNSGELSASAAITVDTALANTNTGTIDLGTGGTIAGAGTVDNKGTISTSTVTPATLKTILENVNGNVVLNDDVDVDTGTTITAGTNLSIKTGKTLTVGVALTIPSGASLSVPEGATLEVTADKLTIEGTITAAGNITNSGGTISTDKAAALTVILGKVTEGTVEVSDSFEIASAEVQGTTELKIASNKTLTVTGTLTVATGASVTGATGTPGSKIVLKTSATHSGTSNFYSNSAPPYVIEPAIPADTYTWVTDADGYSGPGWKAATETSPIAKNVTDPTQITWENSIVTVTYNASSAPITGITVPAGKTLVITGSITGQAEAIGREDATSTITNNGTINTATNNKDVLANLAGIPTTTSGKVVLTGAVTGVSAPLTLGTNLEIGANGSIEFTGSGAAFSASSAKTVKILEGNGVTPALSLSANIASYGEHVTVTNESSTATITTSTTNVTALNALMIGKITANAIAVPSGEPELIVPNDVTLTLTVNSVADGATLKVKETSGTINATVSPSGNLGTIEAADAATLEDVLDWTTINGKVGITDPEPTLNAPEIPANVTLVIENGQTLTVTGAITGNVINEGTIKTDVTTGAALQPILNLGGKIEITATTVTTPTGGTVTVPATTTLIVPSGKTLRLGNGTTPTTLALASGSTPGKLVLQEGGILNAVNPGSDITAATVSVLGDAGTYALADNGGGGTDWTVTAAASGTTTATNIELGKLKLEISTSREISVSASEGSNAGSLTAGEGTAITFAGDAG